MAVGRIAGRAGGQEELQLALTALLIEAAYSDDHFDQAERGNHRTPAREPLQPVAIRRAGVARGRRGGGAESAELFRFTRIINERLSFEERIGLIEMLWEVAYADGVLDQYEDSLLRRVGGLIYVPDRERGMARRRVLETAGPRRGDDPFAAARRARSSGEESKTMTYVVTEACIRCKYMDCVEVCPVDCFYEGENMLVIHPDECIDCGVCEPECPVEAIIPDSEPKAEQWLELNRQYATTWPISPERSLIRPTPTT